MLNHVLVNDARERDRKIIQASRIIVQAKSLRKDGLIHVVAVYEMSTEKYFYYTYTAKTIRSPRRTWKPLGYYGINDSRNYSPDGKGCFDLREFLSRQSWYIQPGGRWKIRYPYNKPAFLQRLDKVGNYFARGERPQPAPGSTFILSEWMSTGKKPSKYREASLTIPKITYDKEMTK